MINPGRFVMRIIRKRLYRHRIDENTYIEFLRRGGAEIGNNVRIFYPESTFIDDTRPWMISIGNDVQITSGVRILTHGYDWSVLKGKYGYVLGSCGKVTIGNNCFIGMNSTILKGTRIGDDCIIGANSLVCKDIPDGSVAVGNPAKVIMSIDEYFEKRKCKQLEEAKELYRCYVNRFNSEPPEKVFDEFFWLFKNSEKFLTEGQMDKMKLVSNFDYAQKVFTCRKSEFNGYDDFLKYLREV